MSSSLHYIFSSFASFPSLSLILSSSDMPRDTRYTNNEPEGTYFQELVVFPTLAPQLACPQNVADGVVPRAIPAAAEENGGKLLFSLSCSGMSCAVHMVFHVETILPDAARSDY